MTDRKINPEQWKKNLYAIWFAEFLAIAGFSTATPIIPFFLQDLGITDPADLKLWVGLCHTPAAITLAVFAPIWGKLSDVYGRKPMLLRAMFGGTLVMGLLGLSTSPYHVLVLRMIQGTLTGTVSAATVLVAATTPKDKAGYSLGMLQMSVFLGSSLGPLIGGTISDFLGHRIAFFVTSGLLLVSALIIMFFVKEEFEKVPRKITLLKTIIPDFSPLKESRELLVLVITVGLVQCANSIATPILPLFVQSMNKENLLIGSTTGLILGASALASALAAALIGRVSFRFGYRKTLLLCLAGAACFSVPQGFTWGPFSLLVFRILGGIFIGGTMPSVNAMIAIRTDSDKQGSIYGLTSSVGSGGAALGPVLGASAAALFGYSAAFFSTALTLFAGSAVILFLTRRKQAS